MVCALVSLVCGYMDCVVQQALCCCCTSPPSRLLPLTPASAAAAPALCRKPVAEFVSEIQALKPSDLSAAVGKLLKSPPSMAVLGDIAHVPRYDQVAKRFA